MSTETTTTISMKDLFGIQGVLKVVVPANDADAVSLFSFLLGSGFSVAAIDNSAVAFGIWDEFHKTHEWLDKVAVNHKHGCVLTKKPIIVEVPDGAESVEINL